MGSCEREHSSVDSGSSTRSGAIRLRIIVTVVCGLTLASAAACTEPDAVSAGGASVNTAGRAGAGKVGVILPDTASERWARQDPKFLGAAFDAADVPVKIKNAEGDRARFVEIAEQMIAEGVRVLMITSIDSATGKVVLERAKKAGITTIDYDRLTLNGGADYYVSFDSERIGALQGEGLVRCLATTKYDNPVVAELNGSPTDHNAGLFKQGYDSVLQPKYDSAEYTKGPDQWVPDWNARDGEAIFRQMLKQQPRIRAVLAADDALADSVIRVLKQRGLNGKVPVTGQDASLQGLQNILAGDQCMTVYKEIKAEAQAAASLAIAIHNGATPSTGELDRQKDPESGAYIPFVKLEPVAIDKSSINRVLEDAFVDRDVLCEGHFDTICDDLGI